jgi:hypothetical protein
VVPSPVCHTPCVKRLVAVATALVVLTIVSTGSTVHASIHGAALVGPHRYLFDVAAKGTPRPIRQVSCSGNGSVWCLRPTRYTWRGTVEDAVAHLSGRLDGTCTASGRAQGHELSTPGTDPGTIASTLIAQAAATAHCSFAITFPSGSISGTALITTTLHEGLATGRSTERAKIAVVAGTGVFAHGFGQGSGKVATPVPPTTFTEPTIDQGPGVRRPIIPPVDTQAENWHLTL